MQYGDKGICVSFHVVQFICHGTLLKHIGFSEEVYLSVHMGICICVCVSSFVSVRVRVMCVCVCVCVFV